MTDITYRDEKPEPADFADLFETTGWNTRYQASKAELEEALSQSWHVVSAYDGTHLVGVGRTVSDGVLYAMIYDMIVRPSHQGRGIGTAMLQRLVARCIASGLREVQLFAAQGKADFYGKRGFVARPADAPGMRFVQNR